jgi:type 1 fimbria pilin
MKISIVRVMVALLLMAAAGAPGFAQGGASSSLSGTVVDQSGGVIPGADVTVRNEGTGAEAKAITAENGTFMIPSLAAGTYTATVSVPNFKQSVVKSIVLVVGVPTNIKVTLQIGGSSETVTVVGVLAASLRDSR